MRIRTIKPEFFLHEGMADAEEETGLPLAIAFIGLLCAADREGRFKWRARRLKAQILPYKDVDFGQVLDALERHGFLIRYGENGEFGCISTFSEHQVVNHREKESVLPNPLDFNESDACGTRDPRVDHASGACPGGREGKGKEGKENIVRKNSDEEVAETPELIKTDFSKEILEEIWKLSPSKSRTRTSKKKVWDEWKRIKKSNRPDRDTVISAFHSWLKCEEWTRDGGAYVPGLHLWIKNRQWENVPEPPNDQNQYQSCL